MTEYDLKVKICDILYGVDFVLGMSHVYGYCKKYEQRCSWVKKCEKEKDTR